MRYFIVADIHGFYNEFMKALKDAGFKRNNPNHTLVVLGDLLDRGPMPSECLSFVLSLPRKILIRGNHEDLMDDMIARGGPLYHDYANGTAKTAQVLTGIYHPDTAAVSMADCDLYNRYKKELVDYYETQHAVFVHGWIPVNEKFSGYTFEPDWRNGHWRPARWYNGMKMWDAGIRVEDKTVFCGHFHTSWGHAYIHKNGVEFPRTEGQTAHFEAFVDTGIVALDACTAYSKMVNCYVLDDEPLDD